MLAIFIVTFVIFVTTEIAQVTLMEYFASATEIKKVQAYHAAQSCLRLNLLRIKGYQQATQSLGQMGPGTAMLDMIWSFPLSWPPSLPTEMSQFDSSTIKKTVGGSLLKEQFISSISAEGAKIDINDLGSPSESLRNKTRTQILMRLQSRVLHGEDSFAERYANFNFERLINHITDWIDADQESLNGGSEASFYSQFRNPFIPPNRPFKTLEELHMVADMTDEIYDVLAPSITLYGVKGINVNQADREVLMSLFSEYSPDVVEQLINEILKRRNSMQLGGPFQDEGDFLGFIGSFIDAERFNTSENRIPLLFGAEMNFRISCVGVSGNMNTEIEAVVYDANGIKTRLQEALALDAKGQSGDANPECRDLQGDALFTCQCQNIADPTANKKCIEDKRRAASTTDQSRNKTQPLLPGPPRMIFQRVR